VLHLPGWFSTQMERALGVGSGGSEDKKVRGDSPQLQRTMWATFAGGKKTAGSTEKGQQLAAGQQTARQKALAAGKAEVQVVDAPAMQKGMRAGGFSDEAVRASAAPTPLWDVFKAKSSSL
jgi:hypothetical protein